MNQKGFATIFGLCMILVIALVVKGIEQEQMNHAYEATDIQAEVELQNAADSGIYAAAKIALADPEGTLRPNPGYPNRRKEYQYKFDNLLIKSESLGTITVETWGERTAFHPYKVIYNSDDDKKKPKAVEDTSRPIKNAEAYVFFSRASADSNRMDGKIYRRAYAYVLADGDATIYFMGLPTSDYDLK